MELVYLIGVPGVGKSYIMQQVMANLGGWSKQKINKTLNTYKSKKTRVLGVYEKKQMYPGTDRLAMDVVNAAEAYFLTNPDEIIIGEGDRLNNKRFYDLFETKTIIYVKATPETLQSRRIQRGGSQTDTFLKRVGTKCENIRKNYWDVVRVCPNNTKADTNEIIAYILGKAKAYENA